VRLGLVIYPGALHGHLQYSVELTLRIDWRILPMGILAGGQRMLIQLVMGQYGYELTPLSTMNYPAAAMTCDPSSRKASG
jgi:hypothetical protein